jgi:type II secretory pathway pseudopilin PulG
MRRFLSERGVTLLELLAVIVLLVLVIGALVSLLTSSYDTYSRTSTASEEERAVTLILSKLKGDLQKAVGQNPVTVEGSAWLIRTQKLDGTPVTVRYENRTDGSVVYADEQGVEIVLAERGRIQISPPDQDLYHLTVEIGDTRRTAAVARYDWGK